MVEENGKKIKRIKRYILKFGDEFILTPANKLYCMLCNCIVNSEKKYFITAHKKTATPKREES